MQLVETLLRSQVDLLFAMQGHLQQLTTTLGEIEARQRRRAQDPDYALQTLTRLIQKACSAEPPDADDVQLKSGIRDCCLDWCQSRGAEGHSHQVQKRSWKLLCQEAVLTLRYEMILHAEEWVNIVQIEHEALPERKQLNLQMCRRTLDHCINQSRILRNTDNQFWTPATPDDVQRVPPSVLLEVLRARVASAQQRVRQREFRWQRDLQPVIGVDVGCVRGDGSQFYAWLEGQFAN